MSGTSYVSATTTLGLTAANLTFDDEFNSFASTPDGTYGWATQLFYSGPAARYGGNGTLGYDSDSSVGVNPFSVQNGVLTITAAKSPTPLPYGLTYTTGLIQSDYLASQLYGYYEMGFNGPVPTGLWSSFFLLPTVNTYGAELDISEVLSKNNQQIYNTTHGLAPTGAPAVNLHQVAVPDLSSGFHTIGADWEPTQITWYVDGVVTSVEATPYGFNLPMYMILGLAVGGTFPGNPSPGLTSVGMNVDYVRSYATANTADVSGSAAYKTASLSGVVLLAGAPATPAAGVAVSLVNAVNQVIATASTDANGYFIFTQLAAGGYRVLYGAAGGAFAASGGPADATTGLSAVTTLVNGAAISLPAETLAPTSLAAVTGTVLFQANATAGGTAQPGVAVTLQTASGTAVDSTVTDATGSFRFANLAAGSYQVVYTPLTYDALQPGGAAGAGGTTAAFTASAGLTTTLAPETMAPAPGEVSGTIVYSGGHSEGWVGTGEGGVTVSLLNAALSVLATTTTASDGTYAFTNVAAGYTFVQVTPPAGQAVANGLGADVVTGRTARVNAVAARGTIAPTVTLINAPAPAINGSVLFSGSGISGGNPGVAITLLARNGTTVLSTTTTSVSGAFAFPNMEPGAYYLTYSLPGGETFQAGGPAGSTGRAAVTLTSAGLTVAPETMLGTAAGVSGTVLYAPSFAAGTPEAGVVVNLVAAGATVATATTDAAGNYGFTGLVPEPYSISFVLPAGQRVQAGGPAYNGGGTGIFALASGEARVEPAQTLSALPGVLNGSVLYQVNGQPSGQASGQAGVGVSLVQAGATVATATTSATGAFSFRYLVPGQYQVQFAIPAGEAAAAGGLADATGLTGPVTVSSNQVTTLTAETLTPLASTGAIAGSALLGATAQAGVAVALLNAAGTVATATTDAAGAFRFAGLAAGAYQVQYAAPAGELLQSGPGGTTGLTATLTLAAGQTLALAPEVLAPAPGAIAGSALLGAAAQAGVAVTLLNAAGTVATASTDAAGAFRFAGLAAGAYQVQYAAPAGELLQSGPGGTTGLTATLTLAAGQTLALAPEVLAPATGGITGKTLFGAAAQAGVAVTLLDGGGVNVLATSLTNSYGFFGFGGLAAGYYRLRYAAPSGEAIQGGPVNTATGQTAAFSVASGATKVVGSVTFAPAYASVAGSVLFAGAPQPGVTVALQGGGGVVATATSDASGAFGFAGVLPGSYTLAYAAPAGEAFQAGDPADPVSGVTAAFTLAAGQAFAAPAEHLVAPVALTLASHTTLTEGDGTFVVTGNPLSGTLTLGRGNQVVSLGGYAPTVTLGDGNQTVTFTGSGGTLHAGSGADAITLGGPFNTAVLGDTPAGRTTTVSLGGSGETLTAGNGSVAVTGQGGSATVALGDGDHTVTLAGSRNSVTLGTGNGVVDAGVNGASIHTAGGNVTATVGGQNDVVDLGPGLDVINAGAARMDTFLVNGAGQGSTTITGFNVTAGNVLDLSRTLAGVAVTGDLSNIGQYVTASVGSGGTTLFVDPTGGAGTPYAFLTLQNLATSVSALVGAHDIRVG